MINTMLSIKLKEINHITHYRNTIALLKISNSSSYDVARKKLSFEILQRVNITIIIECHQGCSRQQVLMSSYISVAFVTLHYVQTHYEKPSSY